MRDAKVPELKELAKELGIEGADGMKKAELLEEIEKRQNVESVAEEIAVKDSSHDSDIAKHPKFAKFNLHGRK